jgi:hypothetical protein
MIIIVRHIPILLLLLLLLSMMIVIIGKNTEYIIIIINTEVFYNILRFGSRYSCCVWLVFMVAGLSSALTVKKIYSRSLDQDKHGRRSSRRQQYLHYFFLPSNRKERTCY